jgi:uncharacterized protein (TIGR03067 family)
MRSIVTSLIICIFIACATNKNSKMNSTTLNGTWIPVKQEMGGTTLPVSIYENQKLILNGDKYTVIAESTDKGTVTFNGNKMDILGKEGPNAGKHIKAICDYQNGLLIVCYNLAGDKYPEKFETVGKPMYFMSVFRKVTKQL